MSGRILKTLVLTLVLGGVFAASAAAVPVTEPSIYSVSTSSHAIVSEKTAGLSAVVPGAPVSEKVAGLRADTVVASDLSRATIYSDHGVLLPQAETPTVVAASDGSGFDWSDAGVASALTLSAFMLLGAAALVIRRQHRPLAH